MTAEIYRKTRDSGGNSTRL